VLSHFHMKLVWQKTGDYINCDPVDHSFVEYWLSEQDRFIWNTTSVLPQQLLINSLAHLVDRVQLKLSKLKIQLVDSADYTSQSTLNTLHRNWVQLHLDHPNITNVFGHEFKLDLARINKVLHELEESWKLRLCSDNNAFPNETTLPNHFGQSNIKLLYENLGRSSYNKWLNFDESLETTDTNNFNELHHMMSVNLNRSFISEPPDKYVYWALSKGFDPVPNELLLANFSDLETKQDTYRALFMKNFVLERNDVIFTT
jgi:hypothetical protein